jgi:hypothetical protein
VGDGWDAVMTGRHFSAWVKKMKDERSWTKTRCSEELGCGMNQILNWERNGPPFYIGLACAALAANMLPWEPPTRRRQTKEK